MPTLPAPVAAVAGPGRRARWRRSVLRRALAAACVAAAVLLLTREVRPPPAPTVAVVQATVHVPAGAVLGPGDVRTARVVVPAAPPGAATDTAEVVGRRVGSGLAPGEVVTSTRLVPRSPADGLEPGAVALHVLVADPGSADVVAPGHRVTVFPGTGGPALARDARVLAVDPVADTGVTDLAASSAARGLLLALPPDAAEGVLAQHGGLDGAPLVNLLVTAVSEPRAETAERG
ncbi:hypothetical protein JQN72_03415 [Phycicoccus sp. CSK15P-2]|uniref:SAF domain-containing protein n=1 Tax=Phycicoccus sp. CSK15P-2 TaxID=2807627 RepID=UPI00194E5A58|nr:SAF domain-containing protein [Phycicoccus sp. CSK15P-2]MBM6403294.1 hypothetical protein [Phycicoccus sp. CSK15P-2]